MIVLGVDPGVAITGYGLVQGHTDGRLELVDYGAIVTTSEKPLASRLQAIYQGLRKLIETWAPHSAAVEELFFSRNVRTALRVGEARGVALLALADGGLEVYEYTPLAIKQAVVGYGQATKNQVQEMVRLLLGLDSVPQPDDAADAIATAICHLHSIRLTTLLRE